MPLDLLAVICDQLEQTPPGLRRSGHGAEQPRAVRGRGPQSAGVGTLFERDPGASAHAAANLLHQPALQRPAGHRPRRLRPAAADRGAARRAQALVDDIVAEVAALEHDRPCCGRCGGSSAARRCASPTATSSASRACRRSPRRSPTWPTRSSRPRCGRRGRKLGAAARHAAGGPTASPPGSSSSAWASSAACELNYSSDIDLIFLYDDDGKTDGQRPITNAEFFDQLARELVRLLTEHDRAGQRLSRRSAAAARRRSAGRWSSACKRR